MTKHRQDLVGKTKRRIPAWSLALAPAGLALGLVLAGAPALMAQTPNRNDATAELAKRPDNDEQRIADLIEANHILADQGVLDGLGHVSVRSVKNPKHYYMSRSRSAAGVTRADIMEFDENSNPIDQQGRPMYGERFIHGEIYRIHPEIQAVVHSHTMSVLPFGLTGTPFQAAIHMAGFIGSKPVPVFDIRDAEGDDNRMLVSNSKTGAVLAKELGSNTVMLMRVHGMVVVAVEYPGGPARWVAQRAYYVNDNAIALAAALKLGTPKLMNQYETKFVANSLDRWWEEYTAKANADARGAAK
jgi:ribulose-5-phosphate 4-epimerase/fuculose-1-phosphate aldolase